MVQKLHDKWVDGEPKAASKGSLIKAYLTRKKVTSPIFVIGPMNTNPLWKLKFVPKSGYGVSSQPTHLLEGIKSPNLSKGKDGGISLYRLATRWQPGVELTRPNLRHSPLFSYQALKPINRLTKKRAKLSQYNT